MKLKAKFTITNNCKIEHFTIDADNILMIHPTFYMGEQFVMIITKSGENYSTKRVEFELV